MGRRLRFLPYKRTLVEVTTRTFQGRPLLKPSHKVREITLGVLGRAQRLYEVELHAFVFLSNHYHLLASFRDVRQMAGFCGYLNSNLGRELARLTGWREKIWGRRYAHIAVSNEESAQVGRLRYLLAQGVKEGLVEQPGDWPGAQCVATLLGQDRLMGCWYDRTREFAARVRREPFNPGDFSEVEEVVLSPLPCWKSRNPAEIADAVRGLIDSIVQEARDTPTGRSTGTRSSHRKATDRPARLKRSPMPWFHCASRRTRRQLREAYGLFLAAYRDASAHWRQGELTAPFPDGCFLPPGPFAPAHR